MTWYHPECGVAELSGMAKFDERSRGDAVEVRAYRVSMASDDFPCLWLEQDEAEEDPADIADSTDTERPRWRAAEAWLDADAIVLAWRIPGDEGRRTRIRFRGRLDRPALAEVTELEPPVPTGAATALSPDGSRLVVRSSLPAGLTLESSSGEWLSNGDAAVLDGVQGDVTVRIHLFDDLPAGRQRPAGPPPPTLGVPAAAAPIVARALAYTRGCAALSTEPDEVAILADHRLLPLSWTRDAYYQALLLLATRQPGDADLVADHLRWLWRRCQRPGGRWLRSHHANGRPKDLAFQADQQLYPMLELADYWRTQASLPDGVDWSPEVGRAWAATVTQVDPRTGLIATAENAADDPAVAPYVSSSQILLWYTALRLAEVVDAGLELGVDAGELRGVASASRQGFDRQLFAGERWLYATDTRATRVAYHDANDLPVALAPLLGFCSADDPGWRATMDFAFSVANPGYFTGERGGLGSAHTPTAWTLGDVQAWIRARVIGDEAGMAAATQRLGDVAFHDGMLPEAYSTTAEPDVRIRHWFAWPGAAFGALLLLDARGELDRLKPR